MTNVPEASHEASPDPDETERDERAERAYRSVSAADLLSLDVVLPFHRFMGLDFAPPEALAETARSALRAEWSAEEQDPDVWIGFPAIWRAHALQALGVQAANQLETWLVMTYGFVAPQQPQWFAWSSLFRRFAHREPQMFQLNAPLRDELVNGYKSVLERVDVEPVLAAARAARLSDWDVELMARRGRFVDDHDDDLDNAGADVLVPVITVIELFRLQLFCRAVVHRLSETELAELSLRAAACAVRVGFVPPTGLLPLKRLVEALPLLSSWPH